MNKNILGIATVAVLGIVAVGGYYYGFTGEKVSANPDFICVKSVTGQSCKISSCDAWQTDGTRICHGKKTTQVGYYHTRTTCESGYSSVSSLQGTTSTSTTAARYLLNNGEGDKLYSNYTQWISGRHSSDFVYAGVDCSITEEDKTVPNAKITSEGTSVN